MRRAILLGLFLVLVFRGPCWAQGDVDDLVDAVERWARENVDERVLELLPEVDRDRVRQVLTELERRLQGDSLVDLAAMRTAVAPLVPLLAEYEETSGLADWLRLRLDFLEVAEEVRRVLPGVPKELPPAERATLLRIERSAWGRRLTNAPVPPQAAPYLPGFRAIFRAEGVPVELVWIAEVESAFRRNARSPVGAVGMFQLMKPTAAAYGLSTFFPDERLDPDKSARAAARYLKRLHARFRDWPLAVAAYNAGDGRVDALLKAQRARTYEEIAHRLPVETQMYVPKVDAVLQRREGVTLARLRFPAAAR